MNRVEVYRWEKDAAGTIQRVLDGYGTFKQYGTDYEDFETGPAQYPIAIVEIDDGTVRSVPVGMIEFIIKKKNAKANSGVSM